MKRYATEAERLEARRKSNGKSREKYRAKINRHQRKYYAANREKILSRIKEEKSWRRRHLMKAYGLSLEDFKRMFDDQEGRCYICGPNSEGKLCVDHDHKTKKVRKLLCDRCNRMIGAARENPSILRAAAHYLFGYGKL
jgi:DNA repair exonuclease SbcCD ATPase subunit